MAKHVTSREKRRARIRRKLSGTAERPRLTVYKSLKHMYAQLVDDVAGKTLVSVGTTSKDLKNEVKEDDKTAAAKKVGAALVDRLHLLRAQRRQIRGGETRPQRL